jgi:sialate O-acetylesterase
MLRRHSIAFVVVLLAPQSSQADVKLPHLFSDHMVLQQKANVPVWGTADPGERVTVRVGPGPQEQTATAGADGKWVVQLANLTAGGPVEMTVAGKNTVTIKDVLVGEVWLASGQSNMEMTVASVPECRYGGVTSADKEVAAGDYPQIRMFTVEKKVSEQPQGDANGQWVVCSPETVGHFSAAAYFFGRDLYKSLSVPIGLINSSYGGTPAEGWTSREGLAGNPRLKTMLDVYAEQVKNYDPVRAAEQDKEALKNWDEAVAKAKAEGKPAPPKPRATVHPRENKDSPTLLFNAMIAPLVPYGMRGAIWYQGESNAWADEQYRVLFPALIQDWRRLWNRGEFPFLFVQLASWKEPASQPAAGGPFTRLREAQLKTLQTVPNTGMAVAIDIGEAEDIHPRNKQDVGGRLAVAARALVNGQKVDSSGPIYAAKVVEGSTIRLRFEHAAGGLVCKGDKLEGFAIAGADQKWYWADARIDGDTLIVSSADVTEPVEVRYAWNENPKANLYNKDGLPASPFRTDSLPKR